MLAAMGIATAIPWTACRQSEPTPEQQAQWSADSAAYESEFATYLRDSTVIDSLAHLVPLDSLRRLYAALERDPDSPELESAAYCEYLRLYLTYGSRPARLAIERLGPPPAPRSGGSRVITAGESCRPPERGPEVVGSTNLSYQPHAPRKPRRPW